MPSREQTIQIYHELADCYDRQGDSRLRDIYLTLAADTAMKAGRPDEAERLRAFLLDLNPHHLLGTHGSFADALRSPDVVAYLDELRLKHPVEVAQQRLDSFWEMPTEEGAEIQFPMTLPDKEPPAPRPRLPIDAGPAPTVAPLRVYHTPPDAEDKPARPRPEPQPARRDPPPQRPPAVPARQAAAPRPTRAVGTPPSPASQVPPAPAPVPAAPRKVATARPPAEPARTPQSQRDAQEAGETEVLHGGAWIATGLFLLMLAAGMGMLVLTLGRPFFPKGGCRKV